MSHYMTALAMKQRGLKPAAKIVLYWLADHHNGETGDCFPSHKRLAELCECSDRDVRRQINKLVELGLVSIEGRTRGNGSQTSNAYILHLSGNDAGTNSPPPMDKLSAPPVNICPTHNLVNINLGNEPSLFGPEDPKPAKRKRAVSLPDGWVPSDRNIEDAMKRGFSTEEINHEAEQFRNYHHAKGSTFKDWDAAWRTWLGNARKFASSRPARGRGGHNALMAGFASYAAGLED